MSWTIDNPFDDEEEEDENDYQDLYDEDFHYDDYPQFQSWIEEAWANVRSENDLLTVDFKDVTDVFEEAEIAPSDELVEKLKSMDIATLQLFSKYKAAGIPAKDIINEMQLLVPGTPTQQLCQLAEFIDYADTQRNSNCTS